MSNIFLFLIILISPCLKAKDQFRNIMYYGDWSIYGGQKYFTLDKIDGSLLTHLIFSCIDVDETGDLITVDTNADYLSTKAGFNVTYGNKYAGVLGGFVLLRRKYPNMKIGISIGGWSRSGDFPKVASSEKTRKKFAENVADFLHYYSFDLVDIDWEFPTANREPKINGNNIDKGCKGSSADTENFTLMLKEIREALDKMEEIDKKHYELAIAMSASPDMLKVIEYEKVLKIVDFVNMMTYDLNGPWEPFTAHHTPLYTNPSFDPDTQAEAYLSADYCIKWFKDNYDNKIDYSKILIGLAPNSKSWKEVDGSTVKDKENPGLYAKGTGESGVTHSFVDLEEIISQYNLKKYWDDKAKANYFYGEESGVFISLDTEESAIEKGKYVKENGLGGLFAWMASYDPEKKVTKAMKESLFGKEKLNEYELKTVEDNGAEVSINIEDNLYIITLSNKNCLERKEIDGIKDISIMPWAEKFYKTISMPALVFETVNGETFKGDATCGGKIKEDNGKIVITPPEWSSKFFAPGDSIIFTLKSGNGEAKKENIKSITLTQKAMSGGEIISKTILYDADKD